MQHGSHIYYVFFWVFPRRLIVVCRRFGTLYRFHLQGAPLPIGSASSSKPQPWYINTTSSAHFSYSTSSP